MMVEKVLEKNPRIAIELSKVFGYSNSIDFMDAAIKENKLMLMVLLYVFLTDKKNFNITVTIMYFSMITTGLKYKDPKDFLKYLYENINEDDLINFSAELIRIKERKEKKIEEPLYKTLDFQTEEKMNKYPELLIDIAKELLKDTQKAYSLKVLSETTTKISHNKFIDFIDYIGNALTENEQKDFFQLLSSNNKFI